MTNYQSFEAAIEAGAKGTDTVTEPCTRCMGNGNVGYGRVDYTDITVGHAVTGSCFECAGAGVVKVQVRSIKARIARVAKQAAAQAKLAAEAAAQAEIHDAWYAGNPEIKALVAELADTVNERGIAFDLLNSRVSIPTENQIAALRKIKADRVEREAARRPVVTGKGVQVEGEILSAKAHESYFGYRTQHSTKIVVKDDRGFKVWGTLPNDLAAELHAAFLEGKEAEGYSRYDFGPDCWLDAVKGRRIRFIANIEANEREDSFDFGFFKLPRKAEMV